MPDPGFFLTLQAIRRQLIAMPQELYLVRLIHQASRRAFPGERLWTAGQLTRETTVRFLRLRNREGCDVYIQPYAAEDRNSGYILLDLDQGEPTVVEQMRAHGHEPCVVLQTSPAHWQAWIRVSSIPLEKALASAVAKQLARVYGGDLASAEGRHLGRLAGFTNQKPQRRQGNGHAPWVRVLHARTGLATSGAALLQAASRDTIPAFPSLHTPLPTIPAAAACAPWAAREIYQDWLLRLRIAQRFPQPDWSIADKWIAKQLLRLGTPVATVAAVLQEGSPGFPRLHADPPDYLRRTLERALHELAFSSSSLRCVEQRRPASEIHAPVPADGTTEASSWRRKLRHAGNHAGQLPGSTGRLSNSSGER
jgi:hypothetical protein